MPNELTWGPTDWNLKQKCKQNTRMSRTDLTPLEISIICVIAVVQLHKEISGVVFPEGKASFANLT
jgi:hypothetical protein